jgi:hypothetical protein
LGDDRFEVVDAGRSRGVGEFVPVVQSAVTVSPPAGAS